jgi:cyclohexadienyl dehydratase
VSALRGAPLALLALCWTLACASAQPPPLRVGTSGDYPPFSVDGAGFDVELARRFAEHLGRDVEWVPFRWPELAADIAAGRFDVAMSGVTWRPARDVAGWLSLSVARGAPCVVGADEVGAEEAPRLAVNRGGILEAWARQRFPDREILATDDNRSLPDLLASGAVDAFVTDRFEVRHFARPTDAVRCEPATDRKVYWVSPAADGELGPTLDAWIGENEAALDGLRVEHLGGSAPLAPLDHLVDLLGRRLELMPAVAAWKRARSLPLEDPEREAVVILRSTAAAVARGLDAASVERLFRLQIELAKSVQARAGGPAPELELDLDIELRPAILRLGDRIVEALARLEPPVEISAQRLELLSVHLHPDEIEALAAALEDLCTARQREQGACPVPSTP